MAKRGNGEGTIYYSEKLNKWVGQFTAGKKNNGKINRKSVYGNTRKEVKQKMTKALSDVQNNTFIEKDDITVAEIAEEIVEDKKKSNEIGSNTYNRNKYTLKIITNSDFGNYPIQKVTAKDIKNFLNSNTSYSESSIKKVYQLLGQTFKRAIERNYITKNPMLFEEAKKPKSNKKTEKVEALSIDEEKELLKVLSTKKGLCKSAVQLMLFTGMRIGETLALYWNDIDDKYINVQQTLTRDDDGKVIMGEVTKTPKGTRQIIITDNIKRILNDIPKTNPLLFPNIKPRRIEDYLARINATNCIKDNLTPHMLRHTYATRCIEAEVNVKVIQKKLGHKNIQTTLDTYASVFEKFEKQEDDKILKYFKKNKIEI